MDKEKILTPKEILDLLVGEGMPVWKKEKVGENLLGRKYAPGDVSNTMEMAAILTALYKEVFPGSDIGIDNDFYFGAKRVEPEECFVPFSKENRPGFVFFTGGMKNALDAQRKLKSRVQSFEAVKIGIAAARFRSYLLKRNMAKPVENGDQYFVTDKMLRGMLWRYSVSYSDMVKRAEEDGISDMLPELFDRLVFDNTIAGKLDSGMSFNDLMALIRFETPERTDANINHEPIVLFF